MNRRIPDGTYGGVRGRELVTLSYSIWSLDMWLRWGEEYFQSRLQCSVPLGRTSQFATSGNILL
ncbi:hypothetical protein, partial [Brevibacillus brevis]|uniref:hypothetical protein n=1 Tax=Brevibacillus brevis TaxID=1393 RepID=UPI001C8E35B6